MENEMGNLGDASAIEDINNEKVNIVSEHLKSIIDELETLFTKDYFNIKDFYIAGGCIYSIWNNKPPKDYDVFCKNKKAINKLKRWFKEHQGVADITTKNAISMGKYQFILLHIGQPNVEVAKFDFKHNMNYFDGDKLHTISGLKYLNDNKLEFNSARARDVLNIITRIPKFVARDMEISQKEILNILELGTRPRKIFSERKTVKKRLSGKDKY